MVVMAAMMTVVTRLRKSGGGDQQHEGQNDQLLHAAIVARTDGRCSAKFQQESSPLAQPHKSSLNCQTA
jgi:hypothetical protein